MALHVEGHDVKQDLISPESKVTSSHMQISRMHACSAMHLPGSGRQEVTDCRRTKLAVWLPQTAYTWIH
jgi:hypothetical protein